MATRRSTEALRVLGPDKAWAAVQAVDDATRAADSHFSDTPPLRPADLAVCTTATGASVRLVIGSDVATLRRRQLQLRADGTTAATRLLCLDAVPATSPVASGHALAFLYQGTYAFPLLHQLTLRVPRHVDFVCLVDAVHSPAALQRLCIDMVGYRSRDIHKLCRVFDRLLPMTTHLRVLRLISDASSSMAPLLAAVARHSAVASSLLALELDVKATPSQQPSRKHRGKLWRAVASTVVPAMPQLLRLRITGCSVAALPATVMLDLQHLAVLRTLVLQNVISDDVAVTSLVRLISSLGNLHCLDLRGSVGVDASSGHQPLLAPLLSQAVLVNVPFLTHLNLAQCALSQTSSIASLARGFASTPYLTHLSLASNMLDDAAIAVLARGLVHLSSLRVLDLADNAYTAAGESALAASMTSLPLLHHVTMPVTSAGRVAWLADALPCLPMLHEAVLMQDLTLEMCRSLARALPLLRYIPCIMVSVSMETASDCDVDVLPALAAAMVTDKPMLTLLDLRVPNLAACVGLAKASSLGDAAASAMARAVTATPAPLLASVTVTGLAGTSDGLAPLLLCLADAPAALSLSWSLPAGALPPVLPAAAALPPAKLSLHVWPQFLPPPPASQAHGIAETAADAMAGMPLPPPRLHSLFELAASAVLALDEDALPAVCGSGSDVAVAARLRAMLLPCLPAAPTAALALAPVSVPTSLSRTNLLRRLLPCLRCYVYTEEPRVAFARAVVDARAGTSALLAAAMCTRCFHNHWLARCDVDHSSTWFLARDDDGL